MNVKSPHPRTADGFDDNYPITTKVVAAVADAEDVSPLDLPPIATDIDPDALDQLVGNVGGDYTESRTTVEFAYHGYDVTVRSDGIVDVAERDD